MSLMHYSRKACPSALACQMCALYVFLPLSVSSSTPSMAHWPRLPRDAYTAVQPPQTAVL